MVEDFLYPSDAWDEKKLADTVDRKIKYRF
jgi:hypothetical protein